LAHALIRSGHRVLLVDTDTSTDGLSLYLLGEQGRDQVASFTAENTLRGYLDRFRDDGQASFEVRRLSRSGEGDHGVDYHILISGKALYGELDTEVHASTVTELGRESFRAAIQRLIEELHELPYDYVLLDTRGGFGFETTDVCALADGFVLVTDPDPSCLFQDRNLMHRVSAARVALAQRGELRGIIVNTASDGEEVTCRRELALEFGVPLDRTYAVPLDLEAMKAHRAQQIPYASPAAVAFSHASLAAFSQIFSPALEQWSSERVTSWNNLVTDAAISLRTQQLAQEEEEEAVRSQEATSLRLSMENESLRAQLLSQVEVAPAGRSVWWSVLLGVTLGFAVLALWMRWEGSRREARLAASDIITSTAAVSPSSAVSGAVSGAAADTAEGSQAREPKEGGREAAADSPAVGAAAAAGASPPAVLPAVLPAVSPSVAAAAVSAVRRPAPVPRRAVRPAPVPKRVVLERPARSPESAAESRSKELDFGGRE
jgi:cellulose biosynthesis protein BcsQ